MFFYRFLRDLEGRVADRTRNCMRIEHSQYRAFQTEKRSEKACGFVDGDLVESVLDLPRETVSSIVQGLKLPAEQGSFLD